MWNFNGFSRLFAPAALIAALATASAHAQETPAPTASPAAPAAPSAEDAAKEFLTRLEKKNSETKSLRASFTQLRVDESFLDEVKSEGDFEYMAPAKFHAEYRGDGKRVSASTVFIIDDRMYSYVPAQGQVDVIQLPKGDSAAVHQMLLGFGVKVDRILEYFKVRRITEGIEPGKVGIVFESKSRRRTLNYSRITITFGEGTMLPEVLRLEDPESVTTISLKAIEINADVSAASFVPKFPDGVDVIEHTASDSPLGEEDF